jgi:hypothetical protein
MNARRWDLIGDDCVRRDADLAFSMTWTYNGVGIDLTGHVLEFKIRLLDGSGAPIVTLDNAANGGITLANQSTNPGKAFFLLTHAQIAGAFSAGRYSYTVRDLTGGGITPMWLGIIEFQGPTS